MYSYTYDKNTGGILLNSSPTGFSKEPRPVYAAELDILGFNEYWNYDKQTNHPYMWAEANYYYYRGTLVAKLKGGNIYTAPEIIILNGENGLPIMPEPKGISLRPVDISAMVAVNREMLEIIEQTTVKKILAIYTKYKDKLDCFHVAFSGGKDSCVMLDLVKKALPKGSFVVVFGDTGMEFPDTYKSVENIKQQCVDDGIAFYTAKSHLDPNESWELFGPPSRVLRWCCSVHKSTPQTLKLREVTGKNDFIGLDFVGVRAHESIARSTYTYENYGAKQRGQFSHNSILEWTSAEIWLYIYANNVSINEAYKKGNGRAGCLFCPMSGGASDYLRRRSYPAEIDSYINSVKDTYDDQCKKNTESYLLNGGWNARKNGRELSNNIFRCVERTTNGVMEITIIDPDSDWLEWIKTLGCLSGGNADYSVQFNGERIMFSVKATNNGYVVTIPEITLKERPSFAKIFRQVFRKASYCKACRVCETNCRNGCISFADSKLKISNCIRCRECHAIDSGCLLFHSLRHPQGGGKSMKSLNSFADHAPKPEWLQSFFKLKEAFFYEHTLGPMMFDMFRRFLKDASLNEKNHFTQFAELISRIGWETDTAQGLILINLVAENPQMQWYVNNFDIGRTYTRQNAEDMLTALDVKPKDAKSIIKSYKRLVDTPLGINLHWGFVTGEGANVDLVRTKCSISDSRVVLYALFKFAEKCNDYKEFTLATLLNDSIDRNGISPSRIFGLDRDDMMPLLLGLSARYPEFIAASFTHDLEKITLTEDKSSADVLALFMEDITNG
jgi:phosphoadenosine phosphosulfate reductase